MRDWLKEKREEVGYTCKEMGEKLGMSESHYFRVEKGERLLKLPISTAVKISETLGIPLSSIITYETR